MLMSPLQSSCVCQSSSSGLGHASLHLSSPVLHQQFWQHRSHHWTVVHTLQEWSELSGPVTISCMIQNNTTVQQVLFTFSGSIVKRFSPHGPLAKTSKEKSSSTTASAGCWPSDRQNLDTTSRKKLLQ